MPRKSGVVSTGMGNQYGPRLSAYSTLTRTAIEKHTWHFSCFPNPTQTLAIKSFPWSPNAAVATLAARWAATTSH